VQAACVFAEEARGAFAHLSRGLVSERDREDAPGRDAVLDYEMGHAMRYDTRFAAPGPSKNQHRTVTVGNGLALRFVESFEEFSLGGNGVHWGHSTIRSLTLSISASPARKTCAILKTQGGAPTEGIDCLCF
jgi:hypothetical protein